MSDANHFRDMIIEKLILHKSLRWAEQSHFKIIILNHELIHTSLKRENEYIYIGLGNHKFPDDPTVRFLVLPNDPEILIFSSISYINGVTLNFKSKRNLNDYDIVPADINNFLRSWTQILLKS